MRPGPGQPLPPGLHELLEREAAQDKQQLQAQLELQAILQAALQTPYEITTYNASALGWAAQDDGTVILMVGLPGGRQLRFTLDANTIAVIHAASAPPEEVDGELEPEP